MIKITSKIITRNKWPRVPFLCTCKVRVFSLLSLKPEERAEPVEIRVPVPSCNCASKITYSLVMKNQKYMRDYKCNKMYMTKVFTDQSRRLLLAQQQTIVGHLKFFAELLRGIIYYSFPSNMYLDLVHLLLEILHKSEHSIINIFSHHFRCHQFLHNWACPRGFNRPWNNRKTAINFVNLNKVGSPGFRPKNVNYYATKLQERIKYLILCRHELDYTISILQLCS